MRAGIAKRARPGIGDRTYLVMQLRCGVVPVEEAVIRRAAPETGGIGFLLRRLLNVARFDGGQRLFQNMAGSLAQLVVQC